MEVDCLDDGNPSTAFMGSDDDLFVNSQDEDLFVSSQKNGDASDNKTTAECSDSNGLLHQSSSQQTDVSWRGTPLRDLARNSQDQFPHVRVGPEHSVLFKLPVVEGEIPTPWPVKPLDVWNQSHVRMPHSAQSLYPVTPTELRKRWELVEQSLHTSIHTSQQLEAAIFHYNSKYCDRWDFKALHSFFSESLEDLETEYFFTKVLPKVIDLALSLPKLVTNGIPLLTQHSTHSVSLSQQQISCLLANAFLCTFPRRNTAKKNSEYSTYPDINFNRLFSGDRAEAKGRINCLHEKLKCLVNYFRRVTTKVPDGVVTFSRHYVSPNKLPMWSSQSVTLNSLYISDEGTIEDGGTGMLEIDFANKFVGGGVLGCGCVQEEIRFVLYPELILARLFTEVLDDTEALIVQGCERFNTYRGYSNDFEWAGNVEDKTPRDRFGRRCCTVVAVDALRFPNTKAQYTPEFINRELNKSYAGMSWGMAQGNKESVATGNWGCGAFRGDARLKALLQLMAASITGRQLAYFTFGNVELRDSLADMHSFLVKHKITVGHLWTLITSYSPTTYIHSLYDHIYSTITTGTVPRPTSPKTFKRVKLQNKKEKQLGIGKQNNYQQEVTTKTTLKLSKEEIDRVLDDDDDDDTAVNISDGVKSVEAKTLNVQQDKELCLKRLSSSWTNLNESKKDFKPTVPSSSSQGKTGSDSPSGRSKQSEITIRKKKISDYFQSVSKS